LLEGLAGAGAKQTTIDFYATNIARSKIPNLKQKLSLFARGERLDYEFMWAICAYLMTDRDTYRHPQEREAEGPRSHLQLKPQPRTF
jgi:hypothetical protein